MTNRNIHRWLSLPIAIFMLIVAVSGIYLQYLEFGGDESDRDQVNVASISRSDAELTAVLGEALSASREVRPRFAPERIEINLAGPAPQIILAEAGGRQAPKIEYDSSSGKAEFKGRPPMSLRGLMIGLHTGKIGGLAGLVLVMAAGIILAILSITGFIVYYDMWSRRRAAGKKGLFW